MSSLPLPCEIVCFFLVKLKHFRIMLSPSPMMCNTPFHTISMMVRFVILHGTDTLAYTSSALSFMLENLGKPVIVTGFDDDDQTDDDDVDDGVSWKTLTNQSLWQVVIILMKIMFVLSFILEVMKTMYVEVMKTMLMSWRLYWTHENYVEVMKTMLIMWWTWRMIILWTQAPRFRLLRRGAMEERTWSDFHSLFIFGPQ